MALVATYYFLKGRKPNDRTFSDNNTSSNNNFTSPDSLTSSTPASDSPGSGTHKAITEEIPASGKGSLFSRIKKGKSKNATN